MRDSKAERQTAGRGAPGASGNGRSFGPMEPVDRGHLLRRGCRFPFPGILAEAEAIRLRRERRVSASFSGIRPLSRSDRG